jgi:hypothetical protein
MTGISASNHAVARLAQRAVSVSDLDWALQLGREFDDGLLVLDKDTEAAALELEREAKRVRRLAGLRIVRDGDTLITIYRARPANRSGCCAARNAEHWRTDQCKALKLRSGNRWSSSYRDPAHSYDTGPATIPSADTKSHPLRSTSRGWSSFGILTRPCG